MNKFLIFIILLLITGCTSRIDERDIFAIKEVTNIEKVELEEENTETHMVDEEYANTEEVVEIIDSATESDDIEDKPVTASILIFEFIDIDEDERIIDTVNEAYLRIVEEFDLTHEDDITFTVYRDQATFWMNTFEGDNNGVTTGYGNEEERFVHITSPTDTSIKSEEEMLKVPVHEMVHVLLPHSYMDIREGIAYYLAGQLKEYGIADIPNNLATIITYQGDVNRIQMSYNIAGYKTKFIIEECLSGDCAEYKNFMNNPDDYTILGFTSEMEFLEAFRDYLEEHVTL